MPDVVFCIINRKYFAFQLIFAVKLKLGLCIPAFAKSEFSIQNTAHVRVKYPQIQAVSDRLRNPYDNLLFMVIIPLNGERAGAISDQQDIFPGRSR